MVTWDLLLAGGRIVDPRHGFDGIADLAIADGRVAAIGPDLRRAGARLVRDVRGLIVAPGLIDLHAHVYHKATSLGVDPDPIGRRSAIATFVDAGSAGAGNVAGLRDFVAPATPFRILAFLNISFAGIFGFDRGLSVGEAAIPELLDVERCVAAIEADRDFLVGVKVRLGGKVSGEYGLLALERAVAAAERCGLPLMTHIGQPPPSYDEILARLRPGDILTHCYRPAPNAPMDLDGRVLPALRDARRRGVIFDIGHGAGAFSFASAEAALGDGFAPDVISSDVHVISMQGPAFDLLHSMSKLMACGLGLPEAIAMATDRPARAIGRPALGHLGPGATADITLIDVVAADHVFADVVGVARRGTALLRPRGLYVAGRPIDLGPRPWEEASYRPDAAPAPGF